MASSSLAVPSSRMPPLFIIGMQAASEDDGSDQFSFQIQFWNRLFQRYLGKSQPDFLAVFRRIMCMTAVKNISVMYTVYLFQLQ